MIQIFRWTLLFLPLVLIAIDIPFSVYFYHEYYSGEVTGYEELEKREYTFIGFGYRTGRYRNNLEIYVAEETRPLLGATGVEMKVIEKEVLEQAREGDKLTVWICTNSGLLYDYDVHEGSINGEFFLTMKNYREKNRRNELGAVILFPAFVVLWSVIGIWYFICTKKSN